MGAVVLALAGCGPSPDTAGLHPFEPQPVAEVSASPTAWSTEAEAARTDWAEWERRTARWADVHISSAPGRPGPDGQPIVLHRRAYVHRQESRGGVILVPGFTEGATLYQELVHDLVANGYSVYVQDHRGQGFSTRLMPGTLGHMDRFEHLIDDLAAYVEAVAQSRAASAGGAAGLGQPLYAIAHSMGGAVLAGLLQRQGEQSPLAAVALVTPMFEPATAASGARGWLDQALQGWCHRGATDARLPDLLGQRQVAGQGFVREREAFDQAVQAQAPLEDKAFTLSHSVGRLQQRWAAREARCEGAHCGHLDARVAGPTLQWVLQACHASAQVRGEAARRTARPVLVLSGGQDTVVLHTAQQAYCAQLNALAPGRCTGLIWPEARHGLLVEQDPWRHAALARTVAFFEQHRRLHPDNR